MQRERLHQTRALVHSPDDNNSDNRCSNIHRFFDSADAIADRSVKLLQKLEMVGPSAIRVAEWLIILWLLVRH